MTSDVFLDGLPTEGAPEVIDTGGSIFKIYPNRVTINRYGRIQAFLGVGGEMQILFEDVSQVLFKEPVSVLLRGFVPNKTADNMLGNIKFVVPGRIGGRVVAGASFDSDAVYWSSKHDTAKMLKAYNYICERVSFFSKEKSKGGQEQGVDISERLMNLAKLKNDGLISDEEFSAAKAKLLGL